MWYGSISQMKSFLPKLPLSWCFIPTIVTLTKSLLFPSCSCSVSLCFLSHFNIPCERKTSQFPLMGIFVDKNESLLALHPWENVAKHNSITVILFSWPSLKAFPFFYQSLMDPIVISLQVFSSSVLLRFSIFILLKLKVLFLNIKHWSCL